MTSYVAMLRAVNVAGTGKLPMAELKAIGLGCGFANVRTFIASGNLLFDSELGEDEVARRVGAGVRLSSASRSLCSSEERRKWPKSRRAIRLPTTSQAG